VRELIEDAVRLGVQIQIVYGTKEDCAEAERVKAQPGLNDVLQEKFHFTAVSEL
jgi:hypothetical protein